MKLENIAGLVLFHGMAILVLITIASDVLRKKSLHISFTRWVIVLSLSRCQAGCWHVMDGFDRAFGGTPHVSGFELAFYATVLVWLIIPVGVYFWGGIGGKQG